MIGSSKNKRENYPRKYFWTQEKETRVKFNPGLSANRPTNNWALTIRIPEEGGGGLLGLIFAGYVPLASRNPYPISLFCGHVTDHILVILGKK